MSKALHNKFNELDPQIPVLECNICSHYLGSGTCKAYPTRIPDEILERKVLHRFQLSGQEGSFVFAKRDMNNLNSD